MNGILLDKFETWIKQQGMEYVEYFNDYRYPVNLKFGNSYIVSIPFIHWNDSNNTLQVLDNLILTPNGLMPCGADGEVLTTWNGIPEYNLETMEDLKNVKLQVLELFKQVKEAHIEWRKFKMIKDFKG